jgi:hypothetical protein
MRSFIRELVRVAEMFFPMAVFCFALSSQLMRDVSPKPISPKESNEQVAAKTKELACLFFEQMTR